MRQSQRYDLEAPLRPTDKKDSFFMTDLLYIFFSCPGDVALTGSKDRTCKVWRVSSGTCLRSLPHSSELNCVTMNSVVLVTGDEFSDVFVWDLEACIDPDVEEGSSKLLLRTLTGHNGTVHSLQFTPTGLVTADVTGLIIVR